ncbi:MAG: trigger factor [Candidatus Hydrogenedentota bacterium]
MECSIEKDRQCKVTINVSLPYEEYAETYKKSVQNVKKNARIDGFRKGKIPENILLKNFSYAIREDFLDNIFSYIIDKSIYQQNYKIVSPPVISDVKFDPGQTLECKILIETNPEVEINDYKKLPLTKYLYEISDKQVDEYIEPILERFVTYIPVKIRHSKETDRIKVDLEVIDEDNNKIVELSGENHIITLNKSGGFFDKLIDSLIDVQPGDIKIVHLRFPPDYPRKEYQNKMVTIKAYIKEIEEKQLPQLNDELVKKISNKNNVEEYRKSVREILLKTAELQIKQSLKSQLTDLLIKKFGDFEVPESSIIRRKEYLLNRFKKHLEEEEKISFTDYLQKINKTKQEFEDNIFKEAEKLVKLDYIYYNISIKENIVASEEDVKKEFSRLSMSYNIPVEKISKRCENTGLIDDLKFELLKDKVINLLIENADIKESRVESRES